MLQIERRVSARGLQLQALSVFDRQSRGRVIVQQVGDRLGIPIALRSEFGRAVDSETDRIGRISVDGKDNSPPVPIERDGIQDRLVRALGVI